MNLFNRNKKFKPSEQDIIDMERVIQSLKRVKAEMLTEIVRAHVHCGDNRVEIHESKLCGCFYCLVIFPAEEIKEWINDGHTAICPKCSIDSVLGDASGLTLDSTFLKEMHKYWF